jgi:hypothetical protein
VSRQKPRPPWNCIALAVIARAVSVATLNARSMSGSDARHALPHRSRALDRRCVVGEPVSDRLERADRDPELLAVGHVLDGQLE